MCNNILELAGNPSTAFTETELSPDPQYNFEDTLPDWLLNRRKRQQKLAEVLKWYQDLHWGWKLGIGIGLLIGAITFTALSGGGWLGVLSVVAQVAIGVGVGVGLYALGALFGFNEFSLEGLGNVALDSFLASSAIAFISSGVSFIKHLARSKSVSTAELANEVSPDLGNKLDYAFGKATGSKHNIDRSTGMLRELERIGIRDNEIGRSILKENLIQSFYTPNNILSSGSVSGVIIKDSLLAGPYGFLRVNSYWMQNKLITIIFMRR